MDSESENGSDAVKVDWDDTLLIKAYNDSVEIAQEELARRIARATNTNRTEGHDLKNSVTSTETVQSNEIIFKVGDYARATFEDGIDYEAEIISMEKDGNTCVVKYIGYGNQEEVKLSNLIPSWGPKARRSQFAEAKQKLEDKQRLYKKRKHISKIFSRYPATPPIPPIPPMMNPSNGSQCEHLTAMLMSWYMSGYYTGVYEGVHMVNAKNKSKKRIMKEDTN